MDEYERRTEELAEAQKQTEAHISVLAQVMVELGRAQARTEESMADLRRAQTHTEEAMADLGRAQTRTEGALTSLTERFEQYISSRS